jgi:uncharacterized protein YecE (DUF72 family)
LIKIGTSGFSFPDWVGPVYPDTIKKTDMLGFYEKELGFKITEINFTYYSIPSPKSFESMIKKTSPDFEFTVKTHKSMTHEIKDKKTGKFLDNKESFDRFIVSIEPLIKEGRLTAVLAQFPFSFYTVKDNYQYLLTFKDRMKEIPLVVEFRNIYWHNTRSIDFLKRNAIGYCVVDEPKLKGLMPYNPAWTTNKGYFRFHGRNKNWFNAPLDVRYDYRYSKEELQEFVPDINTVDDSASETLVMFNNCHAGSAVKNALEMIAMIDEDI